MINKDTETFLGTFLVFAAVSGKVMPLPDDLGDAEGFKDTVGFRGPRGWSHIQFFDVAGRIRPPHVPVPKNGTERQKHLVFPVYFGLVLSKIASPFAMEVLRTVFVSSLVKNASLVTSCLIQKYFAAGKSMHIQRGHAQGVVCL